MTAEEVAGHQGADGRVDPGLEVDGGVLRAAVLGDLGVARGEGQPLRLLLEVVEQRSQRPVPAHRRTLADRPRPRQPALPRPALAGLTSQVKTI